MKNEIYDKMILTPDGNVSSTRVMAWDTWMFLKKLIIIFLAVLTVLALLVAWLGLELPTDLLGHLLTTYIVTILLLFVAIYAPKQFSKMSEVKEIVATAKTLTDKPKE